MHFYLVEDVWDAEVAKVAMLLQKNARDYL